MTDTNSQDADMSSFISMGQDGCNMAFVFNTSLGQGEECQTGLLCIVKELVKFMAISFQDTLVEENKSFSLVGYRLFGPGVILACCRYCQ